MVNDNHSDELSPSDERHQRNSINRRKAIGMVAGSAITLAGCTGNDTSGGNGDDINGGNGDDTGSGNGDDTSSGNGDAQEDVLFSTVNRRLPENIQMNPYNPNGGYHTVEMLGFVDLVKYHIGEDTFIPLIFEDWNFEGETATFSVSDQFTWHNGEPVTARDAAIKLKIEDLMDYPLSNHIENAEAVDDSTVEVQMVETVNPNIFLADLCAAPLYNPLNTPRFHFEEIADRFDDDSEDNGDVRADLTELRIDKEDMIGNGPAKYKDSTQTELIFETFDEYPIEYVQAQTAEAIDYDFSDWSTEFNYDGYEMHFYDSYQALAQLYINDQLDGYRDNPLREPLEQYPDHLSQFGVQNFGAVSALQFNFEDKHYQRRKVRKAIAYIVGEDKREFLTPEFYGFGTTSIWQVGLDTPIAENWLDEEFLESLTRYETDFDRAEQLLEEAGFSQDNNTWVDQDGEELIWEAKINSTIDKTTAARAVASVIDDEFGIASEIIPVEDSAYAADVIENSNYRVIIDDWGAGPHPYNGLTQAFEASTPAGEGEQQLPLEWEVPPIGEPNSSDTITVQPQEELEALSTASSQEEAIPILEKLTWTFNQALPFVHVCTKSQGQTIDTENWNFPEVQAREGSGHDKLMTIHDPWAYPIHCGLESL